MKLSRTLQPPPWHADVLEFQSVDRHVVSRKAAGGWVRARICGGEQRSAARGSPPHQRRTGEKALGIAAFSGNAAPSQPPSRNEQRSAPGPKGRAPQSERPGPPARSLARAELRVKALQTLTNGSNGPITARWSN